MRRADAPLLGVFLSASVLGGASAGILSKPGTRYDLLNKPWFAPPEWFFAPLWLASLVALAIVGWRIWRAVGEPRELLLMLWAVQLVLVWLWPPVFLLFGPPELALLIICSVAFIQMLLALCMRWDRLVLKLLLPCLGWLFSVFWFTGWIVVMN